MIERSILREVLDHRPKDQGEVTVECPKCHKQRFVARDVNALNRWSFNFTSDRRWVSWEYDGRGCCF